MKIHFLGTTGYHPNNKRQTTCIMIPELGIIFDAGTGMFRARDLLQTQSLDIFLSHIHLDHSVGLTYLLDILYQQDVNQVRVHLDKEKIPVLRDHLYHPLLFPVKPDYELCEVSETDAMTSASGAQIEAFPLEHPGGAHGFKLTHKSKSLAYVTDTTAKPGADYIEKIRGVDLLIHECNFPDGYEEHAELTGHSCLTPVAKVAKEADVGRLVLMHFNPLDESDTPHDLKSIEHIFAGTILSEDQMVVDW